MPYIVKSPNSIEDETSKQQITLLSAIIESLGEEVLYSQTTDHSIHLRDKGLIIEEHGLAIIPKTIQDTALKSTLQNQGFKIENTDTHFDGGNFVVFTHGNTTFALHGSHPIGTYLRQKERIIDTSPIVKELSALVESRPIKVDSLELNHKLANIRNLLAKATRGPSGNFKVMALPPNLSIFDDKVQKLLTEVDKDNRNGIRIVGGDTLAVIENKSLPELIALSKYYYHLDCFMQSLPNGKIMILNMDILSPESQDKLIQFIGKDNIIDLKHDYINEPCLLNFITISSKDGSQKILAPKLPDSIKQQIQQLGIEVITPATFDPNHSDYNAALSEKVEKKFPEVIQFVQENDFIDGYGSVHCWTQFIEPKKAKANTLPTERNRMFSPKNISVSTETKTNSNGEGVYIGAVL